MLLLWRLGLGNWFNVWPQWTGQVLVLTHTGRISGLRRRTPVNYAIINDEVYCTAAFGARADWFKNLRKNPSVEVWMPDGWWSGVAEDVSDVENRLQIMRQVLIGSGFASYLFGLNPHMPDEELDVITAKYRLVHIKRVEARTGKNGPGDLAWIWPLTTFMLLPLLFIRMKNKQDR